MDSPNRGHFGTTLFVLCEEVVLFGRLKCIRTIGKRIFGPQAVSFVERFIVLCPYLGESTIAGSTVVVD